ncbi:hypothetical protein EON70_00240 [bacterium]|nr:MAG: hypothetical protein EON70_00240 [bacterium]
MKEKQSFYYDHNVNDRTVDDQNEVGAKTKFLHSTVPKTTFLVQLRFGLKLRFWYGTVRYGRTEFVRTLFGLVLL